MARIGGAPVGTHFRALTALDSSVAASVLAHEHPQTIALVLSKLPPDRALAMLRELPEAIRGDVSYRIATLKAPSPEAVRAVEAGLERRIVSAAAGQRLRVDSDPLKPLLEILTRADADTERTILGRIDEVDPQLAADIRQRLFTIEDLVKLEDKALQLVLRQVDMKELALGLKGTSDRVQRAGLRQPLGTGAGKPERGNGPPRASALARRRKGPQRNCSRCAPTGAGRLHRP